MGLHTNRIIRIVHKLDMIGIRGSVLLLGVQFIHIDWNDFIDKSQKFDVALDKVILAELYGSYPINTYQFFRMLGFSEVHAIDISDYEGADIILDLNKDCSDDLVCRFDVIIDGGTLEHVFDVAACLRNINKMLKPEGVIMHFSPMAGYVNHGFYSLSPELFMDFYLCNGYKIIEQEIEFVMDTGEDRHDKWDSFFSQDCRLFPEWGQEGEIEAYIRKIATVPQVGRMLLWTVAKKAEYDVCARNPMQSVWRKIEGWEDGRED